MSRKLQGDLVASAASVNRLTAGIAEVALTPHKVHLYLKAFNRIISLVEEICGQPIPLDELTVTKELAGPFITGGLLILLWRPRDNHPWRDGTKGVIKECHTLRALEEALRIASSLSLTNNVSLLDIEAFYNSKFKPTEEQENMLKDLLFKAASAKRPNVILCMGDEATEFLSSHKDLLHSDTGSTVRDFYSIHPSRSLHFEYKDCAATRHKLFNNIRQACEALEKGEHNISLIHRLRNVELHTCFFMPAANNEAVRASGVKTIREFLHTLAELCFSKNYRLPLLSVGIKSKAQQSYFAFERWHLGRLRHTLICGDTATDPKVTFRAALIPLLMRLNISLKRISYFPAELVLAYEVDWNKVCDAMADAPVDLEQICVQLASSAKAKKEDMLSATSPANELILTGVEDEHTRVVERMARILQRIGKVQLPRHNCIWIGFADDDKCKDELALEKIGLRLVFSDAYCRS